jgi:hypothetical protein
MSLTSYRAAPPRAGGEVGVGGESLCPWRVGVGRGLVGAGPGEPGGDLLFRALRRSTIGAEGFHGRVRDGIGCLAPRHGRQAGPAPRWSCPRRRCFQGDVRRVSWRRAARSGFCRCARTVGGKQCIRAISTGRLHGLLRFHFRPIDVVVFDGSQRDLVLRRVSRLDAFSGYPVRT